MVVLRPEFSNRDSRYQIPPNIPSQLRQTPWCASILDDPTFLPIQSHSRSPLPYLVGRYSFMSRTLSTAEIVPVWQGFYRPSSHSDPTDNATAKFGDLSSFARAWTAPSTHCTWWCGSDATRRSYGRRGRDTQDAWRSLQPSCT